MRKLIVLALVMVALSLPGVSHARTLKEALQTIKVENTAQNVQTGVNNTITRGPYLVMRTVLKALCAPVYWLEKVKK